MKKLKKILNLEKTIALTSGVLVLSVAIAFVVIAWTGPTADPPLNNAPAPINVSNIDQTKAGGLTVKELGLNNGTGEGDIRNADRIIGFNDLQLRADATEQTKIDLGVGADEIKFYTGGMERMTVDSGGYLYVPKLADVADFDGCFLQIDKFGKVKCYTGSGIPGGDKFNSIATPQSSPWTVAFIPGEVVKIYMYARGPKGSGCQTSSFNIKDGDTGAVEFSDSFKSCGYTKCISWYPFGMGCRRWGTFYGPTYVKTYYYWVKRGDVVEASASGGGIANIISISYINKEVDYVSAEGDILWYYDADKDITGLMNKNYSELWPPEATKLILTADGIEIVTAIND